MHFIWPKVDDSILSQSYKAKFFILCWPYFCASIYIEQFISRKQTFNQWNTSLRNGLDNL